METGIDAYQYIFLHKTQVSFDELVSIHSDLRFDIQTEKVIHMP